MAWYVLTAGTSMISSSITGTLSSGVGVVGVEECAANRSSDSRATARAFACGGSSGGRMKSPGRIEDTSAPPMTLPVRSTSCLLIIRGFASFSKLGYKN